MNGCGLLVGRKGDFMKNFVEVYVNGTVHIHAYMQNEVSTNGNALRHATFIMFNLFVLYDHVYLTFSLFSFITYTINKYTNS